MTFHVLFRIFLYDVFGTPDGIDQTTLWSLPKLIAFWVPAVAGSAVIYLYLLWLPELKAHKAQPPADNSQQAG